MQRDASITARERGLALISRINRWMIAGAVGLTALVSIVAKQSFHGRTLSTSGASQSSSSSSGGGSSSSTGGGIQQPAQSPSSVPAPAVPVAPVVSGGS